MGALSGGLTFTGGTLQATSTFTIDRSVTMSTGGGTFDTNGYDLIVSKAIGGGGGLSKTGTSILTLSGANSYTGGTVVNEGTLPARRRRVAVAAGRAYRQRRYLRSERQQCQRRPGPGNRRHDLAGRQHAHRHPDGGHDARFRPIPAARRPLVGGPGTLNRRASTPIPA